VPVLDQGLIWVAAASRDADGPAVGRRHARHAYERIAIRDSGVGRRDGGPRGPIPALDQCLVVVAVVTADGPAVGRRHARHAGEEVVPGASVWRGDDGPQSPVPALDQRLTAEPPGCLVETDGPALRRGGASYAVQFSGLPNHNDWIRRVHNRPAILCP